MDASYRSEQGFLRVRPKGRPIPERCERCNDATWSKRHRQGYYCAPCAAIARAETCREFNATPDIGFAVPTRRDDTLEPGMWWCICTTCPAEWVEIPGAECWRCERRVASQVAAQARAALEPPDNLAGEYANPMAAFEWASRLEIAIEVGLITPQQARDAVRRADPSWDGAA